MKLLAVSLSVLSLFLITSCDNSNNGVSPSTGATDFAGTYEGQSTLSYGRTGAIATERPQSVTLTVSRITSPDKPKALEFKEQYIGYSRKYSVYLDGSAFTVDKTTEQVSVNGTVVNGIMNGLGTFSTDGKTILLNTSTDVDVAGPYNRSVKIEGTKK